MAEFLAMLKSSIKEAFGSCHSVPIDSVFMTCYARILNETVFIAFENYAFGIINSRVQGSCSQDNLQVSEDQHFAKGLIPKVIFTS